MTTRSATAALAVLALLGCSERSSDPTASAAPHGSDGAAADPGSSAATASTAHDGVPKVLADLQVVDLGTLPGGTHSTARDINDAGEIVGASGTASGETHAFFLDGSGMLDLGTFPGGDYSRAEGINEPGQVVGFARIAPDVYHAFFWESGAIEDLGAYPPEDDIGSSSRAYDINDSGLIVGNVDLAGVVWDLAGVPNFPPFPPYVRVSDPGPFRPAIAYAINDAGQVAGWDPPADAGFRWEAGVFTYLATLGSFDEGASGINGAGEVVGQALLAPPEIPPFRYHAVLWPDPSTVVDLGALDDGDSRAEDVNDAGVVVGRSDLGDATVAMVWVSGLGMRSLGTLGGANSAAFAINELGQVVGESETATGETHAALWTFTLATQALIDIRPGSDRNPVNPRSQGVIPVALLGTDYRRGGPLLR
jgi:probable HAF family extracellular repeat protein